ncbi:MAG: SEL1-like repeat protein [Candidatus Melainabacteria bacterium]|nr:SEL1-like repeat protein [Candidatus Melainabacteria bacterium]
MIRKFILTFLAITFICFSLVPAGQARRAYSTMQGSGAEEPMSGGKEAGFIADWYLLAQVEKEESLKTSIIEKAEGGSSKHQFALACMYFHGKGVEQSHKKAFELLNKSAASGNSNAQNNLGFMYEHGIAVPADLKKAMQWFSTAANFNNPTALCNVGYLYEYGLGVPADTVQALRNYRSAAQAGNKTAKQNLYRYDFARRHGGIAYDDVRVVDGPSLNDMLARAGLNNLLSYGEGVTEPAPSLEAAPAEQKKAGTDSKSEPVAVVASAVPAPVAQPEPKAAEAKEPAREPVKEPVQIEETTAVTPDSESQDLQAGSEKLTEILRRLSKGTSLEPAPAEAEKLQKAAEPEAVKIAERATEPVSEPVPEIASEETVEKAPEAIAEKPAPKVAEEKVVEEKAVEEKAVEEKVVETVAEKPDTVTAPVKEEPAVAEAKQPEVAEAPAAEQPAPREIADSSTRELTDKLDELTRRPVRDKWALVVGISKFDNPAIPRLKYSAKDASDFYNYLVNEANFKPDHVRVLLDEKATQRRLLSELGSKFLARVVKPDDLVVLYFSTHGSPGQLDVRGRNYLVSYDSDPDDLFATGIEMQKLLDSIQGRVLTDRVLLVLDACHSGFAGPTSKGMSRIGNFDAAELAQGSGQLVICSSQPSERSWESERYDNGVFTRNLLRGLRSQGERTTLVDAFRVAKNAVEDEVREDRPGARQTPVLKGRWSGNDLIVAIPPRSPQVVPDSVKSELASDSRDRLVAFKSDPAAAAPAVEDVVAAKPSGGAKTGDGALLLDSKYFEVEGDPKQVSKEYHDAIKSDPGNAHLYYVRAKALIQLQDWFAAMGCLNDALQLRPNNSQYYLGRAYVHYRMGKNVLAREDLNQAKFFDKRLTSKIKFSM